MNMRLAVIVIGFIPTLLVPSAIELDSDFPAATADIAIQLM